MLLTRSPLIHPASWASAFDLHVLSTPPAFVLSQDQTLQKNMKNQKTTSSKKIIVDKEINKKTPPTNNTFVGEEFKT